MTRPATRSGILSENVPRSRERGLVNDGPAAAAAHPPAPRPGGKPVGRPVDDGVVVGAQLGKKMTTRSRRRSGTTVTHTDVPVGSVHDPAWTSGARAARSTYRSLTHRPPTIPEWIGKSMVVAFFTYISYRHPLA